MMTGTFSRIKKSTMRLIAGSLLLGVAAATMSGCSGGQTGGSSTLDKDAKVTLTMWTGQEKAAEENLEKLAKEFEGEHPNVTLNVSAGAATPDDLLQKVSAGFAGNSYPDISYVFGSWASQLEQSNRTLDITDQVADPAVKWDEFSAAARATAQPTGGKTIGFPAIVDDISLIYNKTVFDNAGLAYPTNDWSWDDFRAAAKSLTDPSKNIYGYAYSVSGTEETTWQFWPHLWQHGGAILNDDSTKATFDSQAGVDSLEFLRAMAVDDKSVYLDQTDTKFGQLFASDSIGMITSGPWQLYDLGVAKTQYGVTYLPGVDGDHESVSGPDLWALFDHKDANRAYWSYEFAKWLTDPAQDERTNIAQGNLPLRSSEIESDAFKQQVASTPGLDVMAANLANAKQSRPTVPGYVGLSTAIAKAIASVLQGEGTPADALKAAAETSDKALAEK
jgi:multiple sugar transport system substrate-binding protein